MCSTTGRTIVREYRFIRGVTSSSPEIDPPPRYGNVRDTRVLTSIKQALFLHMISFFFNRYVKNSHVLQRWPELLPVDPNQKAQEDRTWVLDFTPTTCVDEAWRLIGM